MTINLLAMGRIVVIESNVKHRDDVKGFLSRMRVSESAISMAGRDYEVFMAGDYQGAVQSMTGRPYHGEPAKLDGVVTDIYLAADSGGLNSKKGESPYGLNIALELSDRGIPFVLTTARHRHGSMHSWVHQIAKSRGWPFVDGGLEDRTGINVYESEAYRKDWAKVFKELENRMESVAQK